jgi:hypothetical protein
MPEDEREVWAEFHKSGAYHYDDDGAYRYDDDEFLSYRRQDVSVDMRLPIFCATHSRLTCFSAHRFFLSFAFSATRR